MKKIVIYAAGEGAQWVARAYDEQTDRHIWSSEGASSLKQALSEVVQKVVEAPSGC